MLPKVCYRNIQLILELTGPVVLFGVLAVGLYVLQVVLGHKLQDWGYQLADHEINVDEDLPHFFEAVKLSQANELVEEN